MPPHEHDIRINVAAESLVMPDFLRRDSKYQIVSWRKNPGEEVTEGEVVAAVRANPTFLSRLFNTKPSLFQVQSHVRGTLLEILFNVGQITAAGVPIATIVVTNVTPPSQSRRESQDEPPSADAIWEGGGVTIRRVSGVPEDAVEVKRHEFGGTFWKAAGRAYLVIPTGLSATTSITVGGRDAQQSEAPIKLEPGVYEVTAPEGWPSGEVKWNPDFDLHFLSMSAIDFEHLVARMLKTRGFSTEVTGRTMDGGIDIRATRSDSFLSGKYIIQCKRWKNPVGVEVIRDLYGTVMAERGNKGILVTAGTFTKQAAEFAEGKPLELIDGSRLNELLQEAIEVTAPRDNGGRGSTGEQD